MSKARILPPDTGLKDRIVSGRGSTVRDHIKQADARMERLKADWIVQLGEHVAALGAAAQRLSTEPLAPDEAGAVSADMIERADAIQVQAGAFGRPCLSTIARGLWEFLKDSDETTAKRAERIQVYVNAIRLMWAQEETLDKVSKAEIVSSVTVLHHRTPGVA